MNGEQDRSKWRSPVALLAGAAVAVAPTIGMDAVAHATEVFPPSGQPMATGLWWLALGYRTVFGIAGSWVAARLAPSRPMAHSMVLGAVGLLMSSLGAVLTWNAGPGFGPKWYPLSLVATALPNAWLGGWLGSRRHQRE